MNKDSHIIWLTGMSGSGKSTLANLIKKYFEEKKCVVSIIDGDFVRDNDEKQLGFGLNDVRINNMRIVSICNKQRANFDLIIVPVISPYNKIREEIRKQLKPNFHLIYLKADVDSLKDRDTKGLYAAADRGEINDLIGYSEVNPYDQPNNPELIISTSNKASVDESIDILISYINKEILVD